MLRPQQFTKTINNDKYISYVQNPMYCSDSFNFIAGTLGLKGISNNKQKENGGIVFLLNYVWLNPPSLDHFTISIISQMRSNYLFENLPGIIPTPNFFKKSFCDIYEFYSNLKRI